MLRSAGWNTASVASRPSPEAGCGERYGGGESVEVEESVSAAIGAAHRAAAKAKAKARPPTKAELQEKEDMAYLRARLQEPHYIQDT